MQSAQKRLSTKFKMKPVCQTGFMYTAAGGECFFFIKSINIKFTLITVLLSTLYKLVHLSFSSCQQISKEYFKT